MDEITKSFNEAAVKVDIYPNIEILNLPFSFLLGY